MHSAVAAAACEFSLWPFGVCIPVQQNVLFFKFPAVLLSIIHSFAELFGAVLELCVVIVAASFPRQKIEALGFLDVCKRNYLEQCSPNVLNRLDWRGMAIQKWSTCDHSHIYTLSSVSKCSIESVVYPDSEDCSRKAP